MLNNNQKKVVETLKGQVLVVSCPGSGKTTVIVDRAKAMLDSGVNADNILVITFTKEAALQMKERFEKKYGVTNIFFGTIHSICFRALMRAYGYGFDNILKESEQYDFLRHFLAKRVSTDDMDNLLKSVVADMSLQRNADISIAKFSPTSIKKDVYVSLMSAYGKYKDDENKIDFDDMLVLCRDLFQSNAEELAFWQSKFTHVMIDEYQDTNKIQADIFYMLAGEKGNICVVGDDDQSIYGFRAADSSIMFDFKRHYPNCVTIPLDTNYRSEPEIIDKATLLINHNKNRFVKDFKGNKAGKGSVALSQLKSTEEENSYILKLLQDMSRRGIPCNEVSILYRTNAENQLLIGSLLTHKIPFYVTDTPKDFHEDFIFRDIAAYYRISRGKDQKGDVKRILNRPVRYIKADAFKDCLYNPKELLAKCNTLENKYSAIDKMEEMFDDIERLATIDNPTVFIRYLLSDMEYRDAITSYCDYCMRDKTETMELLKTIQEEAKGFATMEEWMNYTKFYSEEIKKLKSEKRKEGVCLSTFHSAKGLEWDNVIILNAVEGTCPHKKAESSSAIEEERRLFYVAVTRAKTNCHILYVKPKNDRLNKVEVSRFVKNMGLVEGKER